MRRLGGSQILRQQGREPTCQSQCGVSSTCSDGFATICCSCAGPESIFSSRGAQVHESAVAAVARDMKSTTRSASLQVKAMVAANRDPLSTCPTLCTFSWPLVNSTSRPAQPARPGTTDSGSGPKDASHRPYGGRNACEKTKSRSQCTAVHQTCSRLHCRRLLATPVDEHKLPAGVVLQVQRNAQHAIASAALAANSWMGCVSARVAAT